MNILRGLATILLSIFSFSSFSQENGDIIHRGPVIFPGYSTVKDISWYYPESQYQSAITDKKITYEKITYSSDSLNVIAYLTTPSHPEKGKYPVVIFNR